METPRPRTLVSRSALRVGADIALDIFTARRGKLACIDTLILLAVARTNVDGILYDRALRTRFGGATRIAPDNLRQAASPSVVALSLRLPETLVERRVRVLAQRGECELTPEGMLITADQVQAPVRADIPQAAYEILRRGYLRLGESGFFAHEPLPVFETAADAPIRSGAAHGVKYLLRLLSTLAASAGDFVNALLLLDVIRRTALGSDRTSVGSGLGVRARDVRRRVDALVSRKACDVNGTGALTIRETSPWFSDAAERNMDHLFQLFAGLAEVGALADFEANRRG